MSRRKNIRPASQPESVRTILGKEHKDLSKYQPVWENWREAVGKEIAQRAHPESVSMTGALTVSVNSATWMQELQFLKPRIIEAINRTCGSPLIKDILFRPKNTKDKISPGKRSAQAPKKNASPPVDKKNVKIIRGAIDKVQDAELKSILAGLLKTIEK